MDITEVRGILREIQALESKSEHDLEDLKRATALEARTRAERDRIALKGQLASLGTPGEIAVQDARFSGGGLFSAIMAAGFDRKMRPSVQVASHVALGKAATFDGDYSDAIVDRRAAPGLGADSRFLYAAFPRIQVPADATSVASFRQQSRTFPSPLSGIYARDVDAVSTKAEVDTATELVNAPLHQIAVIESAVPNAMIASRDFSNWVSNDLQLAYRSGVDDHVVAEITGAFPGAGTPGANIYEDALGAQEEVVAAGYNGTTLVLSPADSLALRLLTMTGGESYAFSQSGTGMQLVTTPAVADGEGFVCDPAAAGVFYATDAVLAVFEENAGKSNSSTVRYESHGVFIVQRVTAIALLTAAS